MEFQYFKLIFLFVISQQCDLLNVEDSIQISSGGAIITIEQNVSDYLIHYMTKENSSVFLARHLPTTATGHKKVRRPDFFWPVTGLFFDRRPDF